MTDMSSFSAKVIGQLALMQSVAARLPTVDSILGFVCQGIRDVPGVAKVTCWRNPKLDTGDDTATGELVCWFQIRQGKECFAELQLELSNGVVFEPYRPYIENFCVALALVFEEKRQRKENQVLLDSLEKRVAARTRDLEKEVQERKLVQEELRRSEEDLRIMLHSIGDGVISTDVLGAVTEMNPVAEALTGWTNSDARGKPLARVFNIVNSATREAVPSPVEEVLFTQKVVELANHTVLLNRDGKEFHIADSGAPILTENGELRGVVLVFRDVTEEYALQEQLRQSQKMEALGQLAGGIAHDFNNQLAGVLGYTEILIRELENEKHLKCAQKVRQGALHSADLTAQLLAFSRRGKYLSVPVNIHETISDVESILKHSIDKRITLEKKLSSRIDNAIGDPAQLQNMILNVALNARDAMPEGGVLSFRTELAELDRAYCDSHQLDIEPGRYILLSVSDTGCGMAQETLRHIFEPFFTTKGVGKGTGMGLASVYGAVKSHGGAIQVDSELDKGSVFKIFLSVAPAESQQLKDEIAVPLKGSSHILLVDDEPMIREVSGAMLRSIGHEVSICNNGREALDFYRSAWKQIDVVILDMIMPELSGGDTAIALRDINPDARIILASGFSLNEEAQKILDAGVQAFIGKPYSMKELSELLDTVLSE